MLQLSVPTHDPNRLIELGARLRSVPEEGVLVIGSGFMTHGIWVITRDMLTHGTVPAWSSDIDAWTADVHARGDIDELVAYQTRAPG